MRSQMAAALGRLAGLGCRHSSMSADTMAGPSSGTSMSLDIYAPIHQLIRGMQPGRITLLVVPASPSQRRHDQRAAMTKTQVWNLDREAQMQQEVNRCGRDSPELAANGHLVRADLPADMR